MTNPVVAVNATLYWANLTKINPKSGKFQVDVANLSPAAVEMLKGHGVNVRNKGDEKGDFITCKSEYTINAVADSSGDPIMGLVGNGTTAKVGMRIKSGVHPVHGAWTIGSIMELRIVDLVVYEADGDDEGDPINYDDAL